MKKKKKNCHFIYQCTRQQTIKCWRYFPIKLFRRRSNIKYFGAWSLPKATKNCWSESSTFVFFQGSFKNIYKFFCASISCRWYGDAVTCTTVSLQNSLNSPVVNGVLLSVTIVFGISNLANSSRNILMVPFVCVYIYI